MAHLSTVDELRAAYARLATAADGERRTIERALHDGVQQDLIAVSVRLQLVRRARRRGPPGGARAARRDRARRAGRARTGAGARERDLPVAARGAGPPRRAPRRSARRPDVGGGRRALPGRASRRPSTSAAVPRSKPRHARTPTPRDDPDPRGGARAPGRGHRRRRGFDTLLSDASDVSLPATGSRRSAASSRPRPRRARHAPRRDGAARRLAAVGR